MVQFSVPVSKALTGKRFVRFSVTHNAVLLAGSRHGLVPDSTAQDLVAAFARLEFFFLTGCARGVDQCFREALSRAELWDKTFVACAYTRRIQRHLDAGLFASCVVPFGISPKAAPVRRSLWMVKRASLVVLFPDDPKTGEWGKGSSITFKTAVAQSKPLFVVATKAPAPSESYRVLPACFQGIVSGYWVIPNSLEEGGLFDDED
jgi:hypothetical protein